MSRELIKFSNDKKGFRLLLIVEALAAAWALSATLYAVHTGHTRTVIYGGVTMFATFYILGRSYRSYRNLIKREKEEADRKEDKSV